VTASAQPAPLEARPSGASSNPWLAAGFRSFIVSMFAVTLGNQIQGTVVAYQVYELTRDPLSLGAVGLAEALPFVSLALLGGHVADARDRRQVSMVSLVLIAMLAVCLLGLTRGHARFGVAGHKWAIYAVVVALGVCRSFLQPARAGLTAELLPPSLYARAIAIRTSMFQLAMVSGPAAGGLLYSLVGPQGAYGCAAALLVLAWFMMFYIPKHRPLQALRTSLSVGRSIREGFAYLAGDRLLLSALLLDLFGVLFGGATALLPVFANEILQVGSRGFGILRAAPAVGALLVSFLLSALPPLRRAGRTVLIATGTFGLSIIGFSLSKSFLLSVALLTLSGAADMVSVLVRSTLLQLRVPGRLLGRITAINQIFIGSSNEIGAFESGVAARLLGVIPSVVFGGSMTLLVTAVAGFRAPELRRLGRLDQWS
jgi:MFS family permease